MCKVEVRNRPFLKKGESLYVRFARLNISTELAIQAADKTVKTWDEIVPKAYHCFAKVFSKEAAQCFPPTCIWDHVIDLKPGAPDVMDCKIYPLNWDELIAQKEWVNEHLKKNYI